MAFVANPVHSGKDSNGCFAQWGGHGKKYYYQCGNSSARVAAKAKAAKQGKAAHAAGYKEQKAMLQTITANLTGKVRYDEMEGRRYLVAPMIMMVEGVHDGSGGRLLYPADELSKTPQMWNYKPVILYHPSKNGEPVSACDPVILSNRKVGVIMNTKFEETEHGVGLKAEAWLDEDRIKKVDERIAEAIEKNQIMELSTGLFTDNESMEGEWNGEKYDAIARNYRADHLALLPDLKGACSVEDGAGFLRLNAKPDKIHITGNAMSHGNIRSLLNSYLQDKDKDSWVEEVYDDFFVFMKDGKYLKALYSIVDSAIEVEDKFTEVVRVVEWRTTAGKFVGQNLVNFSRQKGKKMDKNKVVSALIKSNLNSWDEDDRESLMEMDEEVLTTFQDNDVAAEAAVEVAVKNATDELVSNRQDDDDTEVEEEQDTSEEQDKPQTAEQYIEGAPAELQPVLNGMLTAYKSSKAISIEAIMDNKHNQFTKEQLEAKDLAELRTIVALIGDEEQSKAQAFDFSGQSEVVPTDNVEQPMMMPPVIAAEAKSS